MADFLHDGEAVNRPNNALDIYLQALGCESPLLVKLIMQSIYKNDRREIKHIGCKRFGVQYLSLIHIFSDTEDLPGRVGTDTRYERLSTDRSDCLLSFAAPVGLLLSCDHLYNCLLYTSCVHFDATRGHSGKRAYNPCF